MGNIKRENKYPGLNATFLARINRTMQLSANVPHFPKRTPKGCPTSTQQKGLQPTFLCVVKENKEQMFAC
jgi:hypothetical protein